MADLAVKLSPRSLAVHGNGITVVRYGGSDFSSKGVLIELSPDKVPSALQTLRAFDANGNQVRVVARTKSDKGESRRRDSGPFAFVKDAEVRFSLNGTITKGTLVDLHDTTTGLLALVKAEGDQLLFVDVKAADLTVTDGQKALERREGRIEPERLQVVSSAAEISSFEFVVPGNRWGVSNTVHLQKEGTTTAKLEVRVVWENPLDEKFDGSVVFTSTGGFACEPNLDLTAAQPPSVFIGEQMIAGVLERRLDYERAGAASSVGAVRRIAAHSMEVDAVDRVDFEAAAPTLEFTTQMSAGPKEKVVATLYDRSVNDVETLVIADFGPLRTDRLEPRVGIECVRFRTETPLLAGPTTVFVDGLYAGSSPLGYTNPRELANLTFRARRDLTVVAKAEKTDEKQVEVLETDTEAQKRKVRYELSQKVTYSIQNSSGEVQKLGIGVQRTSNDSVFVSDNELSEFEDTATNRRFFVQAGTGTTQLTITQVWTVIRDERIPPKESSFDPRLD